MSEEIVQGTVKLELFAWHPGDPLPVSPIDGYEYSLEELSEDALFMRKAK